MKKDVQITKYQIQKATSKIKNLGKTKKQYD